MIRQKKPDLLKRTKVLPFGDAIAVKGAVQVLRQSNVNAVGVRDGDQAEIVDEKLRSLPGGNAPEKLVFLSEEGKNQLRNCYGFDLDHHLAAYPEMDHHKYSAEAAKITGTSREVIEADCIRAFLAAQQGDWGSDLINWIENEA